MARRFEKRDFQRILREHPQFAEGVAKVARERYHVDLSPQALTAKSA